jgi:hypothetical protein
LQARYELHFVKASVYERLTATLSLFLKISDALKKGDSMYWRILSTTGGDAIAIAKPLLRRLKRATQAINPQQTALMLHGTLN